MGAAEGMTAMDDATAKVLARLDRMGATYHAAEGWPGWYEARWPDEDEPRGYSRWACQDAPDDPERDFAKAFAARAGASADR